MTTEMLNIIMMVAGGCGAIIGTVFGIIVMSRLNKLSDELDKVKLAKMITDKIISDKYSKIILRLHALEKGAKKYEPKITREKKRTNSHK